MQGLGCRGVVLKHFNAATWCGLAFLPVGVQRLLKWRPLLTGKRCKNRRCLLVLLLPCHVLVIATVAKCAAGEEDPANNHGSHQHKKQHFEQGDEKDHAKQSGEEKFCKSHDVWCLVNDVPL
jgi:hypothetical protein